MLEYSDAKNCHFHLEAGREQDSKEKLITGEHTIVKAEAWLLVLIGAKASTPWEERPAKRAAETTLDVNFTMVVVLLNSKE
jgi:hypothetical protein